MICQEQIQQVLNSTCRSRGLSAALSELFRISEDGGYFPSGVFDRNDLLTFPDAESGVPYRIQINRSRVGYQAPRNASPGCPICFTQVGSEAKPLLRAFEFPLGSADTPFFAQLTPFPLRRHHYIVIQREHSPMRVGCESVDELLDFVERAPDFTACSNSDVRNAGVSILDHHHYQVFKDFEVPVQHARAVPGLMTMKGGLRVELLDYPLAALRLRGSGECLRPAATAVISGWKACAPGQNTCNLTATYRDGALELYLFFRNPGYLTPPDLLRIKSEAVGVVEASGEAIFPPPDSAATHEEIRREGLAIIRRILSGLSPVLPDERPQLFDQITRWLESARSAPVSG